MALPANQSAVRLCGYLVDDDNDPATGWKVQVTSSQARLQDTVSHRVIFPEVDEKTPAVADGWFFFDVVSDTDPDITPTGRQHKITLLQANKPVQTWYVTVDHAAATQLRFDGSGNLVGSGGTLMDAVWLTDLEDFSTAPVTGGGGSVNLTNYFTKAETTTEANARIAAHVAQTDPHTQYATNDELTTGLGGKADTASLATVATSGAYTDLAGKPTIPAAYTDEQAQDAAAAMVAAGTHTGIGFTYNDAAGSLSAAVTVTGDLPEYATTAQTAAVGTPVNLAGKLARYDTTSGAISQALPPATAGRVLAVGWDAGANTLTLTRDGTDVIGSGSATSLVMPLVGEVLTLHCTTAGRWRIASGFKPQAALDTRAATARVLTAWNARRQANWERDNAPGFTVFIDSVNGSDSNTGASPAQAYATLGKLTTAGIAAGARIGLARGSTFTAAFTVPTVTGTLSPTNRVTFGSYGSGALPKTTAQFTIAQPHIDVQDIRFTAFGGGYQLFIYNGTTANIGNQVRRCEIDSQTGSGGLIMGVVGGLVEDCYLHDIWNNVEYPSGNGLAALFTSSSDGTEIRYNVVRGCYKGLSSANTHRSLLFHHNIADKCRVNCIDMQGGTVGYPPRVISNFVWHRPTTANGHGIDTQAGTVGPVWRNNIVYCDYNGTAGNVELYCIDSTVLANTDVDYNLGWIKPGTSGASYAKLGSSMYATLSAYQAAIGATGYAGKEVHSVQADPLLADLAGGVFVPATNGPAVNAGVTVPGVVEAFLGAAPDLGAYEVA